MVAEQWVPIEGHYELSPHKNVRVCSGNVNVREHVGRTEPERLLTPIIELQREGETLDVEKYQYLVGTVHYDNKEGVQYFFLCSIFDMVAEQWVPIEGHYELSPHKNVRVCSGKMSLRCR